MQQNEAKSLAILAKRIKTLRLAKSKSLNSFINNKGLVTTATLSRVENGLVDVKFTTLLKIAQLLDISVADLIKGIDFPVFDEE